jgi:hypothetical protein
VIAAIPLPLPRGEGSRRRCCDGENGKKNKNTGGRKRSQNHRFIVAMVFSFYPASYRIAMAFGHGKLVFDDVPSTRRHWYPRYLILSGVSPPKLVRHTSFPINTTDKLLADGKANSMCVPTTIGYQGWDCWSASFRSMNDGSTRDQSRHGETAWLTF